MSNAATRIAAAAIATAVRRAPAQIANKAIYADKPVNPPDLRAYCFCIHLNQVNIFSG